MSADDSDMSCDSNLFLDGSWFFQSLELQRRLHHHSQSDDKCETSALNFDLPSEFDDILVDDTDGLYSHVVNSSSTYANLDDDSGCCRTNVDRSVEVESPSSAKHGGDDVSSASNTADDDETAVDCFFRSLQLQSRLRTGSPAAQHFAFREKDLSPLAGDHPELFCQSTRNCSSTADILLRNVFPSDQTDSRNLDDSCKIIDQCSINNKASNYCCLQHSQTSERPSCHNCENAMAVMHPTANQVSVDPTNSNEQCGQTSHRNQMNSKEQNGTAANEDRLSMHISDKKHSCSECEKQFDNLFELSEHLFASHEIYTCLTCTIRFTTKYSYARHLQTSLHARRAAGFCRQSGSVNTDSAEPDRNSSIKLLLLKIKRFQCRICDFFGDTSAELLNHIGDRDHHTAVRKFGGLQICVRCRFTANCADMVAHFNGKNHACTLSKSNQPCLIRKHRQTAPQKKKCSALICNYCECTCRSASSLAVHVRRRHTDERPFTCSTCSKSYADSSTLKLHENTAQHRRKLQCIVHEDS